MFILVKFFFFFYVNISLFLDISIQKLIRQNPLWGVWTAPSTQTQPELLKSDHQSVFHSISLFWVRRKKIKNYATSAPPACLCYHNKILFHQRSRVCGDVVD